MEHIDALEAVRRLTLERDALARQVKWLEAENDKAWTAAFRYDAECYLLTEKLENLKKHDNSTQAPERRANPETGTEAGDGGNGAPQGCNVPSRTCEACAHWKDNRRTGYMPVGHCHAHPPTQDPEEAENRAVFPLLWAGDCCGEWQAK